MLKPSESRAQVGRRLSLRQRQARTHQLKGVTRRRLLKTMVWLSRNEGETETAKARIKNAVAGPKNDAIRTRSGGSLSDMVARVMVRKVSAIALSKRTKEVKFPMLSRRWLHLLLLRFRSQLTTRSQSPKRQLKTRIKTFERD